MVNGIVSATKGGLASDRGQRSRQCPVCVHCVLPAVEVPVDDTRGYGRQQNEGEGNKTAAREYNEAQHRFAQSGKVEDKAREAATAMASTERAELERAEAIGRQGGPPTLTRQADRKSTRLNSSH